MSKELYIAEVERIAAELEDQGVPPDVAYDRASDLAASGFRVPFHQLAQFDPA